MMHGCATAAPRDRGSRRRNCHCRRPELLPAPWRYHGAGRSPLHGGVSIELHVKKRRRLPHVHAMRLQDASPNLLQGSRAVGARLG